MRLTKMLGLALVAAIAAMAFIGAGSASAVLCKVKQSPCEAANQYPVPTTILASSPAVKLTGSITVLCPSHVTLIHEKTDTGGKLLGSTTLLDWGTASTPCTGCTKVTTTALGTFDDESTGSGNGIILPLNVTVLLQECPFGLDCTAKATNGTTVLGLTGGTINGTAAATAKTSVTLSGGLCGTSGTWETEKPYIVLSVNGATTGSIFQE